MSTKVQDVFERNPGGHLRCSCALVCDDCSIELVQRDPLSACFATASPHLFRTGIALCGALRFSEFA